MKRELPRKKRLKLWHAVDVAISRGDLVLCGADDFVWFADPAEAMSPELRQLLCEWKVELTQQLCTDAAPKARAAKGGD